MSDIGDNTYSRKKLDLTGQKFGKLTALEPARDARGLTAWRCRCECGNETVVRSHDLKSGVTLSCGCLAKSRRFGRMDEGKAVFSAAAHIRDGGS